VLIVVLYFANVLQFGSHNSENKLVKSAEKNRKCDVSKGYVEMVFKIRTDPGKVWKVLEFNVEICKALKTLENDHRYGKVWKNP